MSAHTEHGHARHGHDASTCSIDHDHSADHGPPSSGHDHGHSHQHGESCNHGHGQKLAPQHAALVENPEYSAMDSALETGVDEDDAPRAPPQRKRLQLTKRSAAGAKAATKSMATSAKSNPFGAARSREQVLADKGIDAAAVDAELDRKIAKSVSRSFTAKQRETLDAAKSEVAYAKAAAEKAPGDEALAAASAAKEAEVSAMVAAFKKENEDAAGGAPPARTQAPGAKAERPKFERPSERRRRLDEEDRAREDGGGGGRVREERDDAAFSSFGSNRDGGGGGYQRDDAAFASFGSNRDREGGGGGYGGGDGGGGGGAW